MSMEKLEQLRAIAAAKEAAEKSAKEAAESASAKEASEAKKTELAGRREAIGQQLVAAESEAQAAQAQVAEAEGYAELGDDAKELIASIKAEADQKTVALEALKSEMAGIDADIAALPTSGETTAEAPAAEVLAAQPVAESLDMKPSATDLPPDTVHVDTLPAEPAHLQMAEQRMALISAETQSSIEDNKDLPAGWKTALAGTDVMKLQSFPTEARGDVGGPYAFEVVNPALQALAEQARKDQKVDRVAKAGAEYWKAVSMDGNALNFDNADSALLYDESGTRGEVLDEVAKIRESAKAELKALARSRGEQWTAEDAKAFWDAKLSAIRGDANDAEKKSGYAMQSSRGEFQRQFKAFSSRESAPLDALRKIMDQKHDATRDMRDDMIMLQNQERQKKAPPKEDLAAAA